MKKLKLDFGKRGYEIYIDKNFDKLSEYINDYTSLLVVADTNTEPLYAKEVCDILKKKVSRIGLVVFEAGEKSKNYETVHKIYNACIENGLDRKSAIVALGGGVCGDMAGFAAATFMRGIGFVQIPTTLLAQTDSSVGGKVGIDYAEIKNIVGAFKQPDLVYINTSTLNTLDNREFAAGMGEVIKYGVIWDTDFLSWLDKNCDSIKNRTGTALEQMIYECCRIKAEVVVRDEKENSLRMILNFGHTIGHGIESAMNFSYLHGECVALGMICAMHIAVARGMIDESYLKELTDLENKYDLCFEAVETDIDEILNYVKNDKKKSGSKIQFVLPISRGKVDIFTDVDTNQMKDAIKNIIKSERK